MAEFVQVVSQSNEPLVLYFAISISKLIPLLSGSVLPTTTTLPALSNVSASKRSSLSPVPFQVFVQRVSPLELYLSNTASKVLSLNSVRPHTYMFSLASMISFSLLSSFPFSKRFTHCCTPLVLYFTKTISSFVPVVVQAVM